MSRPIKFRAWNDMGIMQYGEGSQGLFLNMALLRQLPLMQFTGLLDKNGKEIYEGDILKPLNNHKFKHVPEKLRCEVTWKKGHPGFFLNDNMNDGEYTLTTFNAKHWEVIGNIYENKDLLV